MTTDQARRLAEIRGRWMNWSAMTDTSSWEVTFFLRLLDERNQELAELRKINFARTVTSSSGAGNGNPVDHA